MAVYHATGYKINLGFIIAINLEPCYIKRVDQQNERRTKIMFETALNFEVESVQELMEYYQNGNLNHLGASIKVIERLFQEGNQRGLGEEVGLDGQSPWEAAEEEEFEILGDLEDHRNTCVVKTHTGKYALIAEGPWMVTLDNRFLQAEEN